MALDGSYGSGATINQQMEMFTAGRDQKQDPVLNSRGSISDATPAS
jgi:hypothetical protein